MVTKVRAATMFNEVIKYTNQLTATSAASRVLARDNLNHGLSDTLTLPGLNLGEDSVTVYDEGTWTPAYTGAGGAPTMSYDANKTWGFYTRIGNAVIAWWSIATDSTLGGSGAVSITGLPVAAASETGDIIYTASISLADDFATNYPVSGQITEGTSAVALISRDSGNAGTANRNDPVDVTDLTTGTDKNYCVGCAIYRA